MKIWDRLDIEPSKAYNAFLEYLKLGDTRSQDRLAGVLPYSVSTICNWSLRYNWVERTEAYDDHMSRLALKTIQREIVKRQKTYVEYLDSQIKTLMLPSATLASRRKDLDKASISVLIAAIPKNTLALVKIIEQLRIIGGLPATTVGNAEGESFKISVDSPDLSKKIEALQESIGIGNIKRHLNESEGLPGIPPSTSEAPEGGGREES